MADPQKLFALKKPCANCPFLKEGAIELRPGRVEGIIKDIMKNDMVSFPCHKTTGRGKESSACFGAMTYLWKARNPNVAMRLGIALGFVKSSDFEVLKDKVIEVKNG